MAAAVSLDEFGVRLKPGALAGSTQQQAYLSFLDADIGQCAEPCLPTNIAERHMEVLAGLYVLQILSVKNVGTNFEGRLQGDGASGPRTLLFNLTDGVQEVVAMEFVPLTKIKLRDVQFGTKLAVTDVTIRQGMLMLETKNCELLGGSVAPRSRALGPGAVQGAGVRRGREENNSGHA